MKVFLLHRDRDLEVKPELRDEVFEAMLSTNLNAIANVHRDLARRRVSLRKPASVDALEQDLELETLWRAMGDGDEFLYETVRRVVLSSLGDPDEITYRQQVLRDCLEHPEVVLQLYTLAIEALASERQIGMIWSGAMPDMILGRSVRLLELSLDILRRLRRLADDHGSSFSSEGFGRFFATIDQELSDEYLDTIEHQLQELELKRGMVESAQPGKGDKGRRYTFHRPPRDRGWKALLPGTGPPSYSFELHPRDEAGARMLTEIRARGLNHVADAVARSADHVQSFFVMLRLELAFYLGCMNLREHLGGPDAVTCFPEPQATDGLALEARGLYDAGLALHLQRNVVDNDVTADGRSLVMITGANQGGKSTLLRSLGLAQLMMQAGMFVSASSFRASTCDGVFTHYKREEDSTMEGGKLDEELSRMSTIVDRIAPNCLLLCNESFASTNEREGSEIARQVIRAMVAKRVRVLFVTHMYDLAHGFYVEHSDSILFLRAERGPDGSRTYKVREGEPLPTSYGEDSYRRVFGEHDVAGAHGQ